ncbi:MAG: hypothetical protein JWP76_6183 [Dactylosporangium sp.]|nr:hypothetical protein [Dactylosporangium sp.]
MCSNTGVERREHWWNGTWGRLARHDIYLYEDGGRWLVEAREGGADGRSRWYGYEDEDAATECVRGLLADSPHWRQMS